MEAVAVHGAGVSFAVLGNLARMLLIVLAAELGGQETGNFVHENTICSLIPYIPAIVGLLLIGRFLENREAAAARLKEKRP